MLINHFYTQISEAGTDEAGRGCLAGPVTAAAIILPKKFKNDLLNDSKQVSEKNRFLLKPILQHQAVAYAVTHIYPDVIDQINILNASLLAMQKSLLNLKIIPKYIIVDGNRPLIKDSFYVDDNQNKLTITEFELLKAIPTTAIIKGDEKYLSIAAASVLAKTYRDEYMNQIHEEYPMYNWKKNKGYPTKEHREAIKKFGTTKYHRLTFKLLPDI